MSGITVYNSGNTAQTHLGRWESSNYPVQDGLAIRQGSNMLPLDNYMFGHHRYGPTNWSTGNLNSSSWSTWRNQWWSQVNTIESDRYLVTIQIPTTQRKNHNMPVNPWFSVYDVTVAFGRVAETTPFGFVINTQSACFAYRNAQNVADSGVAVSTIQGFFNPLNTSGSANFSMHEEFKMRVQTRVQPYASMWFTGVQLFVEPV